VSAEGEETRFDSSARTAEAIYTHAFGLPGEYQWVDTNGGPARGIVRVIAPEPITMENREDLRKRLLDALREPVMIVIRDDEVRPTEVQSIVGQSVFWAVERSSGMAVTDARLVQETLR
jgi:hypothetical protein